MSVPRPSALTGLCAHKTMNVTDMPPPECRESVEIGKGPARIGRVIRPIYIGEALGPVWWRAGMNRTVGAVDLLLVANHDKCEFGERININ